MVASTSILRLLPGLFQKTPLTVDDTTPLTHAGMLLAFHELDFLPVFLYKMTPQGRLRHMIGRLGGLGMLQAIGDVHSSELLKMTVQEFCDTDVGIISPMGSLADLLDIMVRTKFGHAIVGEQDNLIATVSLRDLIKYAPSVGLSSGMTADEAASPLLTIPHDSTLEDAINFLRLKSIRRAKVEGVPQPQMVDDRVIIQYAFSYEGLRTLQTNTALFYSRPLYSLQLRKPGTVRPDTQLADAWPLIYSNQAECLLLEDANKILTPWDIVIKPYLHSKA